MSGERDLSTEGLGVDLRGEADRLFVTPPPVDQVMRRGRAMRRRRHLVAAAAVVAAVALPLGVTALFGLPWNQQQQPLAAASPSDSPHVVGAGEPVDMGHGLWMGLLPEDSRDYVVAAESEFGKALERGAGVEEEGGGPGDGLEEPGVPVDPMISQAAIATDGGALVYGRWQLDEEPAGIAVTAPGGERDAQLLRLPEASGWGTYYADLGDVPPGSALTVSAYDADGMVVASSSQAMPGAP